MLGIVHNLFVLKSLLTTSSNVLLVHLSCPWFEFSGRWWDWIQAIFLNLFHFTWVYPFGWFGLAGQSRINCSDLRIEVASILFFWHLPSWFCQFQLRPQSTKFWPFNLINVWVSLAVTDNVSLYKHQFGKMESTEINFLIIKWFRTWWKMGKYS